MILGICNGFQILIKTELLLPSDAAGPAGHAHGNDSGRFEDRWVRLVVEGNTQLLRGSPDPALG